MQKTRKKKKNLNKEKLKKKSKNRYLDREIETRKKKEKLFTSRKMISGEKFGYHVRHEGRVREANNEQTLSYVDEVILVILWEVNVIIRALIIS